MLVQVAWDAAPHVRTPMLALVGAIALPWVGNVVYMLKLGPWPGLNWASLSFCVSGTVIAVIVTRLGLFDLVPTARAIVLDSLSDGVVVLDRGHRMHYANRSARATRSSISARLSLRNATNCTARGSSNESVSIRSRNALTV